MTTSGKSERRLEAWVCPVHGIVEETDLIQGRDPSAANATDPDGWTETYYCGSCPPGARCEATHQHLVSELRTLLNTDREGGADG